MLEQGPDFWRWFDTTQFSYHCVHPIHANMFSIQILLHFSQIVPSTLVLFSIYIFYLLSPSLPTTFLTLSRATLHYCTIGSGDLFTMHVDQWLLHLCLLLFYHLFSCFFCFTYIFLHLLLWLLTNLTFGSRIPTVMHRHAPR